MADSDGRENIEALARKQLEIYALQPLDLVSHANREKAAVEGYRGRQLLELIQNADDANDGFGSGKLVIHLTRATLLAANTGAIFTEQGVESLVVSDASPKQSTRNRFIGCKGLGFRSVLTWSRSPRLVSGPFKLQFCEEHAKRAIQNLAASKPEVRACIERFAKAEGELPVPVMRFPRWADDPMMIDRARRYLDGEACVTIIELPFTEGARGDAAYADALAQLRGLSPEILLFCRNLTELRFGGDHEGHWTLTRTELDDRRTRVRSGADGASWIVHRREGRLEAPSDAETWKPREFELAVALPEEDRAVRRDGRLSVFFPTRVGLPVAVRLHATLDLTDDRNRLIQNQANRAVLTEMAAFFSEVLEQEAAERGGKRVLWLARGLEAMDADLVELKLRDGLVRAIGQRKVFPRLGGDVESAAAVRRPPVPIWTEVVSPVEFPEVLDDRGAPADGLLGLFGLVWYEPAELIGRLRRQLGRLDREAAGACAGRLLRGGAFRQPLSPAPILIDTRGKFLDQGATVFLHPSEGALLELPPWATGVRLLDPAYQRGLLESSGASSYAALASDLRLTKCDAHEYGALAVARAVLACIDQDGIDDAERRRRWAEAVRWLYRLPRGDGSDLRRLGVKVQTARGKLRRASELYLGEGYPSGGLLHRLYGPFDADEFVATPAQLGMDAEEVQRVQQFLLELGVRDEPRMVPLAASEVREFLSASLERQGYPLIVRGRECKGAADVRAMCTFISCEGVETPDRLTELASQGDANALAAYLLGKWSSLVASEEPASGIFCAKIGMERDFRPEPNVRLLNPVLWILRKTRWVPCVGGSRRLPREVSLSAEAVRLLEGVLWIHELRSDDPLLARYGAGNVTALLTRLGAVTSLDSAPDEAIYTLLERLPEVDPEGHRARQVYRTLADRDHPDEDSPAAQRFRQAGKVWARRGKTASYVRVAEARYNSNLALPRSVEHELVLIDIPKRRSAGNVKAVFGVEPLRSSDVALDVVVADLDGSSEAANEAFRRAIPFLYALRLHRKADEDGKERRLFAGLQLRVCERLKVKVKLPNLSRDEVLDQPGDAIAQDGELYMVGRYSPEGHGGALLWQGVARLLDDLVTGEFRAEALLILERRSQPEMEEALRAALLDEADPKLAEAYERLAQRPEPQTPPSVYPLPLAAGQPAENGVALPEAQGAREHEKVEEVHELRTPAELQIHPTDPPVRGEHHPRHLVIAGRPGNRQRTVQQRAPEALTFEVVEQFERNADPPRFTIPVSHIRGEAGFGCDLVSVASEDARRRIGSTGTILDSDILRYIEVKGRSQRTGDIELDGHELVRAEQARERYFVYRVFINQRTPGQFELAILADPMFSKARKNVVRLDLSSGSGADWYVLKEKDEVLTNTPGEGYPTGEG